MERVWAVFGNPTKVIRGIAAFMLLAVAILAVLGLLDARYYTEGVTDIHGSPHPDYEMTFTEPRG